MSYTIDRSFPGASLGEIDVRTRTALAKHGFGVLTEIDVAAVMKAKLGKEMAGYRILGACNPQMAWLAIGLEPKVGTMLPCNLILRQTETGTDVSAIDPAVSMQAIGNADLAAVAGQVRERLAEVVAAI